MTSQQIQTLLAPPNVDASNEKATIFLNSQFRSVEDLAELEAITLQAQERSANLQAKLVLSQSNINALVSQVRISAETQLSTAQELSFLRHSLADELSSLSRELVSSMSDVEVKATLLEDVETLHRNLKELQSVKGYVQIIHHALVLSELAAQKIRKPHSSTSASVAEYGRLQEFVAKVSATCSEIQDGVESQNIQLVMFLEKIRDKTWAVIKGELSASLLVSAEKLHWPMPVDYISARPEERKAFEKAFLELLNLQDIAKKLWQTNTGAGPAKTSLYPLEALVQPVSLRFKYHFEGTRQTNRIDKPEWYFTHVLNVIHEHRPFMETVVQSFLSSTEHRAINAWREFTLLLFPLLSRKLKCTIPSLLPHPSLLAHTIYQALAFDAAVAEEGFEIIGTSAAAEETDKWGGVSEVILGRKEWFEAWMDGEKKFAEDQYHEIISAANAWMIADDEEDGFDGYTWKSTNSARRIKRLVEQITDRYSPLPQFTQRVRFFIIVQLPILEYYHGRILSSLDAFETLSSAFVRAIPGGLGVSLGGKEDIGVKVDSRTLTRGIEGIQRLCKVLLSAKYIEIAMGGWGEELFFLELWTEINDRASLRAHAEVNPSLPKPKVGGVPQDTIFEELVVRYRKLVDRTTDMIVQHVCGEVEGELRAHFAAATSPDQNAETADDIAVSQTLLTPIALLSSHLIFLRSTLQQRTLTTIYRRIASRLAEHILQRLILYRRRISLREGKMILGECELWVETCRAALSGGLGGSRNRVDAPWMNLLQAGKLVGSEGNAWESIVRLAFGEQDDEAWRNALIDIVGPNNMNREEIGKILRTREEHYL